MSFVDTSPPVAQWLEHPSGVWMGMGLISVSGSVIHALVIELCTEISRTFSFFMNLEKNLLSPPSTKT